MPGASDRLRVAELLCARISHDLGGMIGTLAGALELIDDPAVGNEARSVVHQAAAELRHRLELQRASWGPTGASLGVSALRSLAEGLPYAKRCTLDLTGLPADTEFSPPFARVVLNLLLLAAEAVNGSGEIALAGSGSDLVVAIAGPRAAWPAGLAACLTSDAAALDALRDARTLQMPLTVLLARTLNLRLSLLMSAGLPGRAPPLRLTVA